MILQSGFVYSYCKSLGGRPVITMNMGKIDLTKYPLNAYYQAINFVNNKAIK